jgi:hypothetical protein
MGCGGDPGFPLDNGALLQFAQCGSAHFVA